MKTLKTNRLIIRKPKRKDLKDFHDFAKLDDVGPKAGWLPHESKRESRIILREIIKAEDLWFIILKSKNKMIGTIGLHVNSYEEAVLGIAELGYSLNSKYWNQGIISEAVTAVIDHAFVDLKIKKLISGHTKENIASKKIIIKNNFRFTDIDDTKIYDIDDIKEVYMYELKREDYLNENKI